MSKPKTVVVSGSIAFDRLMSFHGKYSELISTDKLETLAVLPIVDAMTTAFGGVATNIVYSLALLGDSPILLGSIGKDAQDEMRELAALGVVTSHLHISHLPTATFTAITDANQAQIGGFFPGAMLDSEPLTLAPWKNTSSLIIISPHDPVGMERQINECIELALPFCFDPGPQVTTMSITGMQAGIEHAAVLMLNEYELSILSKRIDLDPTVIKQQVPLVITTLGKNGSMVEGTDCTEPIQIGITMPKQEVDPTGAGDAFRGGFLYGYVRDWPPKVCAQFGATVAAYAVECRGTKNHRFTLEEVMQRYQHTFGEALPQKEEYVRL